ncbi:YqaA family protein [Bacillus sp. REN3]|uniref:YqaA family protein n=1 Tax=Bacillus sp. REN3 TaxID=2802440 RepID=UPI001AEE79E2|nr:YqaA family protein [Bacillus sp. REN3]
MREMIHVLEEWLLEFGSWGLFIVSFMESSFFPIPPDVLMIPMGIANPDRALWYAFITTAGSVLGALLGWYIGRKVGRPVLRYFIKEERIATVENYFAKYGAMAILIAGFTPIPYKVFTIFSGIARIRIPTLIIWSIIGRGARFFLEAALIIALGEKAMPFIEENFAVLTAGLGGIVIVGYLIYLFARKSKNA